MRISVVLLMAMVAGCSAPHREQDAAANAAAPVSAVPATPNGMRGAEPATSPAALDARKLVERYYALIKQRKFGAARALWGNKGADVGGDTAAFAATITPYSVYTPKVGSPTEIQVVNGMQYVNVAVDLHVRRRSNKAEADREGVVMLYRSIDPQDGKAELRDWRIRGTDIRLRN